MSTPEDTAKTPPQRPTDPHHARLTSLRPSTMGGAARLTVYGSSGKPVLYADDPDMFSGVNVQPARDDLVRFAREVLAFLGATAAPELPAWRPANNGTGSRRWFLCRYSGNDDMSVPLADRYLFTARGTLVRYGSCDAAQRAADKLNAAQREDTQASTCGYCGQAVRLAASGSWQLAGEAGHDQNDGCRACTVCSESPDNRHDPDGSADDDEDSSSRECDITAEIHGYECERCGVHRSCATSADGQRLCETCGVTGQKHGELDIAWDDDASQVAELTPAVCGWCLEEVKFFDYDETWRVFGRLPTEAEGEPWRCLAATDDEGMHDPTHVPAS